MTAIAEPRKYEDHEIENMALDFVGDMIQGLKYTKALDDRFGDHLSGDQLENLLSVVEMVIGTAAEDVYHEIDGEVPL